MSTNCCRLTLDTELIYVPITCLEILKDMNKPKIPPVTPINQNERSGVARKKKRKKKKYKRKTKL